MSLTQRLADFSSLILIVLCAFALNQVREWKLPVQKPSDAYLAPSEALVDYTFGLKYQISDLLWIRLIQDFDYCEKKINETDCIGKSWLFKMLDIATRLDPYFGIAYRAGAIGLSVLISDYAGASIIFDRGVERMPNDGQLAYRAAYHALYEEKDKAKAARLLKKAGENGAPPWVFSLAGRLWAESGQMDLAEALLKEMILTEKDPQIVKRLEEKLAKFKKDERKNQ